MNLFLSLYAFVGWFTGCCAAFRMAKRGDEWGFSVFIAAFATLFWPFVFLVVLGESLAAIMTKEGP